jgi:adenylate cyclase
MKKRVTAYLQDLRSKVNHNWVGGGIGAGIAFVLGFGLLDYQLNDAPVGVKLINLSYDIPFTVRGIIRPTEAVLVYQDEQSSKALNEPDDGAWDRSRHAELLTYLKADGAKAVVFDVIFAGPGANPESTKRFADAIRSMKNVVLGANVVVQGAGQEQITLPDESLRDAGAAVGVVQLPTTTDGVIRQHFHGFRPGSLALDLDSMSWTAAKVVGAPVTKIPGRQYQPFSMNYYGPPGTIPNYSYYQVIQTNLAEGVASLPKGLFREKVVFVGARQSIGFVGTGKDEFPSPYAIRSGLRNLSHPGVEIHATEFLNLYRNDWLSRLTPETELMILTLVGIVFGFGLVLVKPLNATVLALIGVVTIAVVAAYLFTFHQAWFVWLVVMTQIALAWFWSVVFNSVRLFVQKRLMEQSLGMYVSPSRVKQIAKRADILKPGAEKQVVSVLFSDIANFTSISEGMDSDVLAKLMNDYFEAAVTHCIQKADGTVVKFIGDAIFAIWNAPETQAGHQIKACHGALLLRDKVTEFMKDLPENLKLVTRIGLHTGVANVGNFGSSRRFDYTAIGENINLASRMEGLNKYVGTIVLITRDVKDGIGDLFVTRLVGHFQLKGFEKVVEVYELVSTKENAEPSRAWRETFAQGLEQFQKRNFDAAELIFRRVLDLHENDGPAKFYFKQIAELRAAEQLPDDWIGEIELKEK